MHAGLRKELGVRHSLLNLSVHDLVEEFARHSVYAVFEYLAGSSNLSTTTRCRANKYSKKHLKVCEADALKQVGANIREEENKNCSSLYYSDSNSDTATRKIRIKASQLRKASKEEELAKTKKEKRKKELDGLLDSDDYCLDSSLDINSKDNLEDEEATTAKNLLTTIYSTNKQTRTRDSLSARLTDAYILYFKELLSNNSGIFANAIGMGKTRAIVLAVLIGHFCFFSDSPLENIGRLTKEEAIEMRINTTNAIFKALAAANKLFIIVCGFRKVDKHVFRAYNTISVMAQRTIIRKGGSYVKKRAILLSSHFNATNKRDSVTGDCIYKIEDARNMIANIKHNASKHELSYKDILEKEGLNKLEASRRVIFNCFKMQAIFKTYSSCKVKRFTLNSVKDLFTNLSKDYFLVREVRAITKSSLNIAAEDAAKAANTLLLLKEVRAKILIELYKPIVQADSDRPWIIVALMAFAEVIILIEATHVVIIELQDSIVYFNLDSELELKVLGKQDVKTTF
ncbi:hypothetical protein HBI32_250710 [Parastagonospora nodorum]|nr:hypothetical protein HBI32_250710 [Parastagonospora nodorum]